MHLPPERVERTLTLLREGTNVNLVGMRSSGRSALVREVAEGVGTSHHEQTT